MIIQITFWPYWIFWQLKGFFERVGHRVQTKFVWTRDFWSDCQTAAVLLIVFKDVSHKQICKNKYVKYFTRIPRQNQSRSSILLHSEIWVLFALVVSYSTSKALQSVSWVLLHYTVLWSIYIQLYKYFFVQDTANPSKENNEMWTDGCHLTVQLKSHVACVHTCSRNATIWHHKYQMENRGL